MKGSGFALANNKVRVSLTGLEGTVRLELKDIHGVSLFVTSINNVNKSGTDYILDLSNYAKGIYSLQIINNNKIYHAKIIKQ